MQVIPIQGPPPATRNAAPAPSAGALLAEGRVLAAEVLARLDGGLTLLGTSGGRLLAHSTVPLEPGQSMLFRVGRDGETWVLRPFPLAARHEGALITALRDRIGFERPLAEVLGELAGELRRALGEGGSQEPRLRALLAALEQHVLQPGEGGEGLRSLLERSGLSYEARIARALLAGRDAAAIASGDLKATLLLALSELPEGRLRQALEQALKALEADQLLHLARREGGEPARVAFPVAEDGRWVSAHLRVDPRHERDPEEREGGEPEREERGPDRAVLGVDLSHLGPLEARLSIEGGRVEVRLRAERPATVALLEQSLPDLDRRLAALGFACSSGAEPVPAGALAPETGPGDLRLLDQRHLMDLSA